MKIPTALELEGVIRDLKANDYLRNLLIPVRENYLINKDDE